MIQRIQKIKSLIATHVDVIAPIKLQQLSQDLKAKKQKDFPDLVGTFEYPPKPIDRVIQLFLNNEHGSLNFFDIINLMRHLKLDHVILNRIDPVLFTQLLEYLYSSRVQYIRQVLMKSVASILINTQYHRFKESLQQNLNSIDFIFLKWCISKNIESIYNFLNGMSLRKNLDHLGLNFYFKDFVKEFIDTLVLQLRKEDFKSILDFSIYENNLLDVTFESLDSLYFQLETIISIIEKNQSQQNVVKLEFIIIKNLGDIKETTSGWYVYQVPEDLINRYKALKGLFEFRSFLEASKFLSKFSPDFLDDNERDFLLNRALFWSNYESRFSSVKMWINNSDKYLLEKSLREGVDVGIAINDLEKFNLLSGFNNEACLFEFGDDLLILEFFRKKDAGISFISMIFEEEHSIHQVNRLLQFDFNLDTYSKLKNLANFCIKHDFMWQGWVDLYLRERNVFPDEIILQGHKKFKSNKNFKIIYGNEGLQETRNTALKQERKIAFEDVISKDCFKYQSRSQSSRLIETPTQPPTPRPTQPPTPRPTQPPTPRPTQPPTPRPTQPPTQRSQRIRHTYEDEYYSYNEWQSLGYQVQRGEKSTRRIGGVAVFSWDQVEPVN
jgi:hypothetical protein